MSKVCNSSELILNKVTDKRVLDWPKLRWESVWIKTIYSAYIASNPKKINE